MFILFICLFMFHLTMLSSDKQFQAVQSFLRTWKFLRQSRKSPHFMEPECTLLCSHEPTTCSYPKPDQSSTRPHPICWRYILILSSNLRLGLPSCRFPSDFTTGQQFIDLAYRGSNNEMISESSIGNIMKGNVFGFI